MAASDARAAGLFFTHEVTPRIRRHYLRLVAESGQFVQWHFLYNEGHLPAPSTLLPYTNPAAVMPTRYRVMASRGGVMNGHLDVMYIPCVLAARTRHVWICEYDVDYSGSWGDLFSQFHDVDADLVTTTLQRPEDFPDWDWWPSCTAPEWVDPRHYARGFHPLMRVSREFAHEYAVMMSDPAWQIHYEFTMPTAALACGARIEDIGGGPGPFTPAGRATNYTGNGRNGYGTYMFRPPREQYFHEAPETFAEPNRLYHPVKPDVALWEVNR